MGQNLIPHSSVTFEITGKVEFDAIKTSGEGICLYCSASLILLGMKISIKSKMKKLKVVEVLQHNDVNMKVISTKRTTVKMALLHLIKHARSLTPILRFINY